MKRFKIWLVWRWLPLISTEELRAYAEDRRMKDIMNVAYSGLCKSMLKLFEDKS